MQLLPTQEEVALILKETGALRWGHFALPEGTHTNQFLQLPLALRYHQHTRTLSVALSRLLRANPEISALIPELSVVTPAWGGLPVAFGMAEALRCRQVYWAEDQDGRLRFRQYMEDHRGEKVVMVDDTLRTGKKLRELKGLLESQGAQVLALAVVVHQARHDINDFDRVPLYTLAKIEAQLYPDAASCPMCRSGEPAERVRM
ncbi:MAG: phosphoribosyltransferase [Acidobacteria bacterium]|nr:phosphoribosyltransferase [Acidobacteriota bacterium]